jgi:hypothetical protein
MPHNRFDFPSHKINKRTSNFNFPKLIFIQ